MSNYKTSIQDAMDVAANKSGHEGWIGYTWECVGDDSLVTGCVPDGVYSKGPRKGRPRFSKPVEGTRTKVVVTESEIQSHAANYEKESGHCFECKGSGKVSVGWSAKDGTEEAECSRCKRKGLAQ